ncbi:NAD(P)H-hydrate epimerase [Kineococcus radiotolerans]|uniref:Bifunctional NAD(P)H-hydrate repair enzyme n=1 Tax=Kineococcus radiotolerans (strain ATCC BAA-149 / DSM 14245 / SRS30216) TaxID=266940 RepID=A6W5X6_KINRD|nr:NAD(P)H-hydrate epimerase [Kineococcus radiotolerans]ABS02215.1 carbohydrate kinase, YjeF related protein [Kineococcus radiotolerans SRS30216 = ATCC BAA-149]
MIAAHSVADVRAAERAVMALLPPGTLMHRAAAALDVECARVLREATGGVSGRRAVVLAGSGDNGGDALLAAARLARRGVAVTALTTSEHVHPEGLAAARAAGVRTRPWQAGDEDVCAAADLVLDGIAGIGGRGGLRPVHEGLSALDGPVVVAVDLPSGLDADTGAVTGELMAADVTVTFGTAKPAHLLAPAAARCGRLVVVDIGTTDHLPAPAVERVELADVAARWRRAAPGDDKYSRGVVGVVAGGPDYTGAAVLAVEAAVRAGAGMVRYLGPQHPAELVRQRRPEVVVGEGRVQAWVLGPGVSPDDPEQQDRIRRALASGEPAVVDAGALAGLPAALGPHHVLTPHAGELARLLGAERRAVEADPLTHARRVHESTGATVLLKGSVTTVVGERGVLTAAAAPTWLSTAGAGDVLAGVLGAALAARPDEDPAQVAADAAVLHGWAATLASAGGPLAALDVADAVPAALTSLPGWAGTGG